jgi:tRNA(Arg) A34 adenosine deaminase TadA
VVVEPLPSPWPEVFSLMWEAYDAGEIPVGAVITDSSGDVVSRGRNRMFEVAAEGAFARSRLAHAEINALIALSSDRIYPDHVLFTALEPCHLCLSAAITARVGRVHFAAADRYGGAVGKLVPSRDHEAHPIVVEGPLDHEAGRLPELLLIAHSLWRRPSGDVVAFYRELFPQMVERAERLPSPRSGASLSDAFRQATAP